MLHRTSPSPPQTPHAIENYPQVDDNFHQKFENSPSWRVQMQYFFHDVKSIIHV